MIRIERDGAWWANVASHPAVAGRIGTPPWVVAEFVTRPGVTPLAAEHGGFLFSTLDGLGMVRELHTLFTPEGWGREVALASHQAFRVVFSRGCQVVVTHEQEGWSRSRPPLSHGWTPAGPFVRTPVGDLRMWMLSVAAWAASPAVKRSVRRCQ